MNEFMKGLTGVFNIIYEKLMTIDLNLCGKMVGLLIILSIISGIVLMIIHIVEK